VSLIQSWLDAERQSGRSKTEAVARLNHATGAHHSLSRVGEWERGVRELPSSARAHMVAAALPWVLADCGVSHMINYLIDQLS